MSHTQIRTGQLIAPFGPGSLYTDRRGIPHIICGLDHWFTRWDQVRGRPVPCEKPDEFERFEPRLAALLRVDRFRTPPDYRHLRAGVDQPPNAGLHVPAHRFPGWYRHSKTGRLKRFNLDAKRIDAAKDGGRWIPVRFVAACGAGHLCEFPWKRWSRCECDGDGELYLTDMGGSELSSISVYCRRCRDAGRGVRTLAGVTQRPVGDDERGIFEREGIHCPGERPWLGADAAEACTKPLVGALINQTNLYFPQTVSAIHLPEVGNHDEDVVRILGVIRDPATCVVLRPMWDMKFLDMAVGAADTLLSEQGIAATPQKVAEAIRRLFEPSTAMDGAIPPAMPETGLLSFRRAEFNVLRRRIDDAERMPDLRVVPSEVPEDLFPWFSHVHLVERLKETRAFHGFARLEPSSDPLASMPEAAMNQLFRNPPREPGQKWLPAIEVFGEGVYLEFREEAIRAWQQEQADWLKERLSQDFVTRIAARPQTLPPLGAADWVWASRYLLVHSIAHILINQMVFECGYSTASLRERLYVSGDPESPMAGLLIYTAAGDSEGTLGGLVRLGRPERLGAVFQRALSRASWCSADPICSENLGGQGAYLANLAACHCCILLPETSCETINHGLDRAMVVGTPEARERGAFSALLGNTPA